MRVLAIVVLAFGISAARADSFTSYNLANVATNFALAAPPLTGTLTFDTTTELFTFAQIATRHLRFSRERPRLRASTKSGSMRSVLQM